MQFCYFVLSSFCAVAIAAWCRPTEARRSLPDPWVTRRRADPTSVLQFERGVEVAFDAHLEMLRPSRVGHEERKGNRRRTAGTELFHRSDRGLEDALARERVIRDANASLFGCIGE